MIVELRIVNVGLLFFFCFSLGLQNTFFHALVDRGYAPSTLRRSEFNETSYKAYRTIVLFHRDGCAQAIIKRIT